MTRCQFMVNMTQKLVWYRSCTYIVGILIKMKGVEDESS